VLIERSNFWIVGKPETGPGRLLQELPVIQAVSRGPP
jgi:hypothetical protein